MIVIRVKKFILVKLKIQIILMNHKIIKQIIRIMKNIRIQQLLKIKIKYLIN